MSIVRRERSGWERSEDTDLSIDRAVLAHGGAARRSWRFNLVAAALLGFAAILRLVPAEAEPARREPAKVEDALPKGAQVTLSEVTIHEAGAARLGNIPEIFRRDVEAELSAIDWGKLGLRRRYKLSATVMRLESARTGERNLTASCTVSAAVRDAERGTLLVIVEGRARAEDTGPEAPQAAPDAERDALAGAVRSAISAVPEAIRRAQ